MNQDSPARIADLPPGVPPPSHDARADRLSLEYTLPESILRTLSWRGTKGPKGAVAPPEWLVYRMSELTPQDQADAVRLAGGQSNGALLTQELVFKTIVELGGASARGRRDDLEFWWKALGPKGRKMVESSFMDMSAPSEEEIRTFLATGKP